MSEMLGPVLRALTWALTRGTLFPGLAWGGDFWVSLTVTDIGLVQQRAGAWREQSAFPGRIQEKEAVLWSGFHLVWASGGIGATPAVLRAVPGSALRDQFWQGSGGPSSISGVQSSLALSLPVSLLCNVQLG